MRSGSEKPYIPQRGDVVWITLDPQVGHEQAGRRPALILSPRNYNERAELALFCPLTGRVKGYPYEVLIPDGLLVKGAILADHVKNLDWQARAIEFICVLPSDLAAHVLFTVRTLLD